MFGLKAEGKHQSSETLVILGGNSNPSLVNEIADFLSARPAEVTCGRFPEGEIRVQIRENIRGKDVFIVQSTCTPPNDNIMELLILIDAAKRASAMRITAVLPFFGYARQDRKDKPRVPIAAKLVANLITKAGADRVLTMDLHAGQIQGFFDIPVDHLYSISIIGEYLLRKNLSNVCVVTPDIGGTRMARAYSKLLSAPLAIVDKRREDATKTQVVNIIGSVEGKNVLITDDLISTGGSLVEAARALKEAGALDVYAAVVHPVLAGPAVERLENSAIKELIVTNSIPMTGEKKSAKVVQLSVAPLLAEAIYRIHRNESISVLFSDVGVEA
ncbi:MAG: ribose-phosphate pyrophosphokinase [Candidatus Omnitrophota bacterium]|nr:ribose-phosphate pyrophosphokinase [Candidatus Omnitrophota bacterium]